MTPSRDISRLLEIMAALRTPVTGCPWDLEQNFATIAPYTIEEAYEVADAIARGDLDDLREELGDLLLQVVYHARMAEEQNAFAFGDVVEAITRKMIRRHPHVFADKDGDIAAAGVKSAWDRIKAEEKAERAARRPPEETDAQIAAVQRQGRPAGADPRDGTAAQGLHRRLRLERSPRGAAARSARKPTRSRPRSTATMPTNSLRKPAISCLRWSIWRAMSAPIRKARCAAPTPNSNAALPISSARWPPGAARSESASLEEMDALWNEAKVRSDQAVAAQSGSRYRKARCSTFRNDSIGLRVLALLATTKTIMPPWHRIEP